MKQLELFKNYKYKQVEKPTNDPKVIAIEALIDEAFYLGVQAGRGYTKDKSRKLRAEVKASWRKLKESL